MPVPKLPPTPQSSVDIAGQDKPCSHARERPLQLPPPAVRTVLKPTRRPNNETGFLDLSKRKESRPASPSQPQQDRKRRRPSMPASAATPTTPTASAYSLPPPPTRSRTIIQMQPGASKAGKAATSSRSTAGRRKGTAVAADDKETDEDKAVGGSSSAAPKAAAGGSKRLARKTAHSVIERRRRSKMNEEFETMKDMIPACRGQTMHKLAILQAGIDYLRYLERCVAELKAANESQQALVSPQGPVGMSRGLDGDYDMDEEDDDDDGEEDENEVEEVSAGKERVRRLEDNDAMLDDDDEEDDGVATPSERSLTRDSRHSNASTTADASASLQLRTYFSRSSTSSTAPSPIVHALERERYIHSAEASPALQPNASRDADYEATTALLMLNTNRSSTSSGKSGRGLSVQDLLSG